MEKLEVPAPGQSLPEDPTQISMELWVGLVLAVLIIFFGWFLWVHPQEVVDEDPFADIEDPGEREQLRDRAEFEDMVERGTVDRVDWADDADRAQRAMELGPRPVAEAACRQFEEAIAAGQAPPAVTRTLLRVASRRSHDAPWTCLLTSYLQQDLAGYDSLREELAEFWGEIQSVQKHGEIMKSTVADFHRDGVPADQERVDRWLRRCALAMSYEASPWCQQVIAGRAPEFGDDLLEMLITHIDDPDVFVGDLVLAARALTYFAQYGQPNGWYVAEAKGIDDYEEAFRRGALFILCRLATAPADEVRTESVTGLRSIAEVTARARSPHFEARWREACRYAFGDRDDPTRPVSLSGVLTVRGEDGRPDYGMTTLVDRGLCADDDAFPTWYCGTRRWGDKEESMRRTMAYYFAHTSYVEWHEVEDGEGM